MKKLLLTVIATLAFSGAILAQPATFWPEFNSNHFQFPAALVAFVQIDGGFIEGTDNYADLEIAAYTGDQCRGHAFMDYYPGDGDPHPIVEMSVFYNNGESVPVTFSLYDHTTGIEYTACASNMEILTGVNHTELYFNYDNAVVLNFTTPPTYTLPITGYANLANPDGGYYLIASPVRKMDPQFVSDMLSNNYDLYWFNQSGDANGNQWMNYKVESFFLQRGKGYLYANSQDVLLSFTGTASDPATDVTIPLEYDAASPFNMAGVNLVGNPFAQTAYIAGRSFYVMNSDGTEIVAAVGNSVEAMEGIFVIANDDSETVTFSTTEPSTKDDMVSIDLTSGKGFIDRAIVNFGDISSLPKLQLMGGVAQVYIPQGDEDYAVVQREGQGETPFSFRTEENGSYTLSFNTGDTEFSYLHLIDNLMGTDTDLLEAPYYSFHALTSDQADRFKLVYVVGTTGVGEDFAFVSDGNIILSGKGTLEVYDVTGRMVGSCTDGARAISTASMTPGVYMLRLVNGKEFRTQKIVVK